MVGHDAMTTAEYALHRGVSESYICRMRRKGNLIEREDGLIAVRASDELLDGVTNPVRGGKRSGSSGRAPADLPAFGNADSPAVITVQEAVRRERLAKARIAEIELGEQARHLTRVDHVNRAVFTLVRQALNQLQGMSGRISRTLAAETDAFRVGLILDAEVANICADMRTAAENLLAQESRVDADDVGDDDDSADAETDEEPG